MEKKAIRERREITQDNKKEKKKRQRSENIRGMVLKTGNGL